MHRHFRHTLRYVIVDRLGGSFIVALFWHYRAQILENRIRVSFIYAYSIFKEYAFILTYFILAYTCVGALLSRVSLHPHNLSQPPLQVSLPHMGVREAQAPCPKLKS